MRSVNKSAECDAAPEVIDAVIRFVVMLEGASQPYNSCVILPIAPIGVTSVSPVARAATIDSRNVTSTAMIPIHQVISNKKWPSSTQARPVRKVPATNQDVGTSISSIGSCSRGPSERLKAVIKPPIARTIVLHFKPKDRSPDVTIMAVAGHRVHVTRPR